MNLLLEQQRVRSPSLEDEWAVVMKSMSGLDDLLWVDYCADVGDDAVGFVPDRFLIVAAVVDVELTVESCALLDADAPWWASRR